MKFLLFNIFLLLITTISSFSGINSSLEEFYPNYDTALYHLQIAEKAKNASIDTTLENALLAIKYINRCQHDNSYTIKLRQKAYLLTAKAYYTIANSTGTNIKDKEEYLNNAEKYFTNFHKICLQLNDTSDIATAYNELALVKTAKQEYEIARDLYKKSYNISENSQDYAGMARVRNNSGQLNMICGDTIKAAVEFQHAIQCARLVNYLDAQAEGFYNLAFLSNKQNNPQLAEAYLDSAMMLCKGNEILTCKGYLLYSEIYSNQANFEAAYRYLALYTEKCDEVLGRENIKQINALEGLLNLNEKNKTINDLSEKNDKQSNLLMIMEILIGFLLITFIGVIVLIKRLSNSNRTINEQRVQDQHQKEMLEEYTENMNSSLTYASRLQRLIIRGSVDVHRILNDFFVLYQPKDVVSGDFYYVRDFENRRVVAVADCTGHGVPAAFLSVLNITFLNEIFSYIDEKIEPEMVLELLRIKVRETLNQKGDTPSSMDGMDIGIVISNRDTRTITYAGAYIDLLILKAETFEVQTVKANRTPIGWFHREMPFSQSTLQCSDDDILYMFSDGYTDQINKSTEKFTKFRMRKAIQEFGKYSLEVQKEKYAENFQNWKSGVDQVDDVLLFAVRVKSLFDAKKI